MVEPSSIAEAAVSSAVLVGGITGLVAIIFKKNKFSDIIRGLDWYPSLSIMQFFAWTLVISFVFFFIYFVRIHGGVYDILPSMPSNLLALMGISVASPIAGGGVATVKYNISSGRTKPKDLPKFGTMLLENGKPSLTRYQMFLWTWIGILIYLWIFVSNITDVQDLAKLSMPDIDSTLVILMGLSHSVYIGGKAIAPSGKIQISKYIPSLGSVGNQVNIFGINFGTPGPNTFDFTKNPQGTAEYRVLFGNISAKITSWTDSKIVVQVPTGLPTGDCEVMVESGGNQTDTVMFQVQGTTGNTVI